MDLSSVVRYYVDRMLKEVPGMKVLLLDADTTRIVSTVYSQSEILEQEVYLVERLDADRRDQLFHLKVFLQLHAALPHYFLLLLIPLLLQKCSVYTLYAPCCSPCACCCFCVHNGYMIAGSVLSAPDT